MNLSRGRGKKIIFSSASAPLRDSRKGKNGYSSSYDMTAWDLEQLHLQTITNKIGCALYAGEHDLYTLGISLPLFEVIEDLEIGFPVGGEVI